MTKTRKSTALYSHPFSRAYWRDALLELKDTKMLVATALLIALRIVMKPLDIPLGPNLYLPLSMLPAALGAMIYGPVMAIPAGIISDVIGYLVDPNGVFFLPFTLMEVASTMTYALFLYRTKVTPIRVTLSRFCICLFLNVLLQPVLVAWQYVYMGYPGDFVDRYMNFMTIPRIVKNLIFFPVESVVMTVFLRALMPVARRAGLIYCGAEEMRVARKQAAVLVLLVAIGLGGAYGYLVHYYNTTSLSAAYSTEERSGANRLMRAILMDHSDEIQQEGVLTVVESAKKKFPGDEVTYVVAVYASGGEDTLTDAMWAYSKSKAAKDDGLTRIATMTLVFNEDTYQVLSLQVKPEG